MTNRLEFPGGDITPTKFGRMQCEGCNKKAVNGYCCTWGGGWEHEPAYLCFDCFSKAIDLMIKFRGLESINEN